MKHVIKSLIGPFYRRYEDLVHRVSNVETAIDCLLFSPRWALADDIGFNAQNHRKQIYTEVTRAIPFEAIIETGTWTGNTTGYMATVAKLPVYTCELDKRFGAIAKMRLVEVQGITFSLSDSRQFLRELAKTELVGKRVFIYLDAHWYQDLPLAEELDLISQTWKEFVIMIDDFAVPGDAGYGFDDYGGKARLSQDVFGAQWSRLGLAAFYPSLHSAQETGAKRGSVILARQGATADTLAKLPSLCRTS